MAPDGVTLPNEVETAVTLLKIMSGAKANSNGESALAPKPIRRENVSSVGQPKTHRQGSETNRLPFQVQISPALTLPPQVPNPLHNVLPHLVSSPCRPAATSSKKSAVVAPPYVPAAPNANYLIHSPSTYSFLQSMISQQRASLASCTSTMSNIGTPNPLLLSNQLIPLASSSASSMMTAKEQQQHQVDIRREEVEKALNSKPQRGRKRRNLNEEERQELTRTRNREHAKSTRERKKQRHTELLEIERWYQDMRIQQELQSQRRQAVCLFIGVRQAMLRQILNDNSGQATDVTIDSLILSRSDFRYHIRGQRGGAEIDGLTLMGLFDRSFAALLPAQGAEASYRYEEESIALTERGDASVECSICFGSRVFKTLHMNISFAEEKSKILAVDIAFLHEESERHPSLGNQVSHPSVVSLDDRFALSRSKTEDEDNPASIE